MTFKTCCYNQPNHQPNNQPISFATMSKPTTPKQRRFPTMDLGAGTWKLLLVVGTFYSSVHLALKPTTKMGLHENQYHPLLIIPFKGWYSGTAPQTAPGLKFHTKPEEAWMRQLVSPAFAVGLPMLYVLVVLLSTRFMANFGTSRKKFLKQYIQPVYNVLQIVVCGWMVWGLWPDDILHNPFSLNTLRSKDVEFFVFVHYLTKYLE